MTRHNITFVTLCALAILATVLVIVITQPAYAGQPVTTQDTAGNNVNYVSATIVTGQAKVATTGTAVQFQSASARLANGVTFCAATTNNSAGVTIGGSSVNNTVNGTGNGLILLPGACGAIAINNANLLYVNGTAGDYLSYIGN